MDPLRRRLPIAVGLLSIVFATPWWDRWTGDAVIHLVYADNAARGAWFVYNPGETSAGSSSLAFTLLMSVLVRLLGLGDALVVQKVLIAASMLVVGHVTTSFLLGLGLPRPATAFGALAVAANVGYLFSVSLGMESGLFAACVATSFLTRLFLPAALETGTRRVVLSGLVAALMIMMRPEGTVAAAALAALGVWRGVATRESRVALRLGIWLLVIAALVTPAVAFYHSRTGFLLDSASTASRLMFSRRHAVLQWGLVLFDPSVLVRLAAWWPLTAGLAQGTRSLLRAGFRRSAPPDGPRAQACASALVVWGFIFAYTFVTGIAFVARYTVFLLPLASAVWGWGARDFIQHKRPDPRRLGGALTFGLVWMSLAYLTEAAYRATHLPMGRQQYSFRELVEAPLQRARFTDGFLARLGRPLPEGRPVVVAMGEVQVRFWLDERVRVVSTDGCTAPLDRTMPFLPDGRVDEEAFLLSSRPDYVLAWVRGRGPWSGFGWGPPLESRLSRLEETLAPGEEATLAGCVRVRRTQHAGFRAFYESCPPIAHEEPR